MAERSARIVQLSDTHFSADAGVAPVWQALVERLHADPPDLVVHSGDIVLEDPDDAADRTFALGLMAQLPRPRLVIPGNHDVGGYDVADDARRSRRVGEFVEAWGGDRFAVDVAGWRVVGVNAYLLGTAEHDAWLMASCAVDAPVLVFVHQPTWGDPRDGWEMAPAASEAFERAIAGAPVRVIASGHRHCAATADRGERRSVWAPSLTLMGEPASAGPELRDVDPRPGFVEHRLAAAGSHASTVVHR